MEVFLEKNETIDDLQLKGLRIIQNENWFKYGIDSVLLSDFAKDIKDNATVVDLGTGTGVLGLLLIGKTNLKKIYGIEVQKNVSEMAKKSVKLNDLEEKFEIINANIKDIIEKNYIKKNSIDYVITNPPYKEKGTGIVNEIDEKIISRHEITANLEDFIRVSNDILKDKGTIYMVHRPERLVDIITIMRKYKIEPKRMRFVHPKIDKEPNIVLIEGKKGASKFIKIEKPLIIYDAEGKYTEEIRKIYNIEEG